MSETSGPLLLYVEDEPLIRELGVTVFEDAGFAVLVLESGADAIKALDERGADLKALVTDIDPDAKVKISMNEINAAQRLREAAIQQAEADKIRVVKAAEGEAESKALQGQGIANQRKAIIEGLKESVENFNKTIDGTNAEDVMNLVLMTQYFDTLKEIGMNGHSNTIMIPHSPGGMRDISEQMRDAIITANQVTNGGSNKIA